MYFKPLDTEYVEQFCPECSKLRTMDAREEGLVTCIFCKHAWTISEYLGMFDYLVSEGSISKYMARRVC